MATPPTRNEIAGTPTNAEAKAGFGKLWDYVTGLLGLSGDAEAARTALKIADNTMKNRLINAQGLINQRAYVSGTATTTANQYTVDRWRVVTSGQNLTFSTTNNVVTFTAPAGGVEQVIEGLNLESGTYVLSWTGTATATVAGNAVTNGGTVTVVGGTNTTVKFSSGTFSLPQFEKGSTATSFDYRPYGAELQLCQRYYYKLSQDAGNPQFCLGQAQATTQINYFLQFPQQMRTAPTLNASAASTFWCQSAGGSTTPTSLAFQATTEWNTLPYAGLTGATIGRAFALIRQTGTAFIEASAEL